MEWGKGVILAVLLAVATVAVAKTTVDWDGDADFSKYRTYSWKDGTPIQNPLMQERAVEAVNEQLQAKGMKQVVSGSDVQVVIHASQHQEQQIVGSSFGYGRWGGWGGTTSTSVYNIPKGSLMVDLVDSSSNKLVWRGSASETLSDKPEKNTKKIRKVIEKMFKKYPPEKDD